MYYLSGIHALNINCDLETCGDWHQSGIQWSNLVLLDSEKSIYGDYGIETNKKVPGHTNTCNVANHIRALLDLIQQGNFCTAQGMKENYICNESYTQEIFQKVSVMRNFSNWTDIDGFMTREYYSKWMEFKEREGL